MQHLDVQVIEHALNCLERGESVWLCTVLSTFGSSPREPGSIMAITKTGEFSGSLSGGCVEDDFLQRLRNDQFPDSYFILRYGDKQTTYQAKHIGKIIVPTEANITLPCGGALDVLVQYFVPDATLVKQLKKVRAALYGKGALVRRVSLDSASETLLYDNATGPVVQFSADGSKVNIKVGPVARLLIAGISPVTEFCAEFASMLGFEVIICDARAKEYHRLVGKSKVSDTQSQTTLACLAGTNLEYAHLHSSVWAVNKFPADVIILPELIHARTAVVALTHDPRIDDLALMEAVDTNAFYIGVMGSLKTSANRAERLRRSGGLNNTQTARIHMPIGLNLGSRTPAEIALAVMADILRVYRGIEDNKVV